MEARGETQERYGIRIEFDFGSTEFRYSIRDFSGAREFYIPYEDLLIKSLPSLTIANVGLYRRLWLIPLALFALSILTINKTDLSEGIAAICLAVVVGLIAAKLLKLFSVSFTLLPVSEVPHGSEGHSARIIKDSRHDTIISELTARWASRMRALHGSIKPDCDPASELARFEWLHEQGVITGDELEAVTAELTGVGPHKKPATKGFH